MNEEPNLESIPHEKAWANLSEHASKRPPHVHHEPDWHDGTPDVNITAWVCAVAVVGSFLALIWWMI